MHSVATFGIFGIQVMTKALFELLSPVGEFFERLVEGCGSQLNGL